MKINIDRLCKLAGVSTSESKRRSLNEASNRSMHDDASLSGQSEWRFGKNQLAEKNQPEEDEDEKLDELIEVDEVMLVQELRRAKKVMNEARNRRSSAALREQKEIKRIVEEEVNSVLKELNLTSGWIYGNKKPARSRKGSVATAFPGIGFNNSFKK